MKTFPLRIGTPDGMFYEGEAERIICRTVTGDMAVLAGHCDTVTALGMGEAKVVMEDGTVKKAACIGGMLTVTGGVCRVMSTTWEWADDIDEGRAQRAKQRAEEKLAKGGLSDKEYKVTEHRLHRALVRLDVKK